MQPVLKTAGSVMTAATSSPRSDITRTKLSGSFQVSTIKVSASSRGTPGPAATGRGIRRAGGCGIDVVAPVDGVLPAVVVPLEADDDPPSGVGPGEADGGSHDLAARVGETHHLDARDRCDHLLGRLDLEFVGQAEAGSEVLDRLGDRIA